MVNVDAFSHRQSFCVSVFTTVAMSGRRILAVIFMSSYLCMMSAGCDCAFKALGQRVCVCFTPRQIGRAHV